MIPEGEGGAARPPGRRLERLALPALKDAPTLYESGLKDFNVQIWHGLYAPKGTPPEVLTKLNTALRAALKDPELIKRQTAVGLTVVTDQRLDPAHHKAFVERRTGALGQSIKEAGVHVQ